MQIELNPDEELTRKEYLKRKKKQKRKVNLKNKSKIIYIMPVFLILLIVYVCTQYYFYNKSNSFKYTEGDEVKKQKVFKTYYVTEGYTYDPIYSLNCVNSDGFEDRSVLLNGGLTDIKIDENYIYGLKQNGLYRLNKENSNLECLVEKNVFKYSIFKDRIYFICETTNKLKYIDLKTKSIKDIGIENICEILIDESNIFVVQDEKIKKTLLKFDKDGQNKQIITCELNVSYIIQDEKNIFFVNKKDESKIYKVLKDGSGLTKVGDISSVSDKGSIKEIDGTKYMFSRDGYLFYVNVLDGNTLWKINIETKEKTKVLSVNIEILQSVSGTVFYKVKNEMGVYLYNVDTLFMSQVTKRKIKEFYVDTTKEVKSVKSDNSMLQKN